MLIQRTCAGLVALLLFSPSSFADDATKDTLVKGSVWKGELTQRGKLPGDPTIPPKFDCEMVVTKRDGENFECELRETTVEGKLTYLCKGTVTRSAGKPFEVKFTSVATKDVSDNFQTFTEVAYKATLKGKTLEGTWKYPKNDKEIELEGKFEFTLEK
jgi:hypothetical protein